ncbi:hypothetical protein [Paludibacterium denitrificans]|uniref:Uncharacterized protein n=1 Tax=Paludibacterium denitrificans TaxID=2675226 RepID=A0A844GEJ8_9NEIS|nr:hypothetical protein [Paludibacterium denitrificans]MTD34079.1 hypothetical protein [Paludibacterium denitrificans]
MPGLSVIVRRRLADVSDELWVLESGDIARDAAYVVSLRGITGGVDLRRRELKRLELLYGAGYRMNVERAVKEGFDAVASRAGSRERALAAIGKG